MKFIKTLLDEVFSIRKIVSLHYFEFAKDHVFKGEKHDFWEFLYVDKGEVEVMADTEGYKLKQGDIIFHKPNEFHSIWANKKIAPNLVVISFECKSEAMKYFENKIFSLEDSNRNILADIIKEGFNSFLPPLGNPNVHTLIRRDNSPFGCQQMIKTYLEQLLIRIVREGTSLSYEHRLSSTAKERTEKDIVIRIKTYMQQNIYSPLSLQQVCKTMNMSRTHLSGVFKQKTGMGVMAYYNNLRIEQAKKLIREGNHNYTEISDMLNYSSIHYFSRHFKKATDMTPSEYSKSVKARSQ